MIVSVFVRPPAAYMEMRLERLALMPAPLSKIQGERVKADCAVDATR
jgi:hypothetical protein